MTIGKKVREILEKGSFSPARRYSKMTPGDSLRVMRDLQELSQNELANLCGIPQSTISAMESGRIKIGVERAKTLARALKIHPAVIVFADWDEKAS
jgi:transcriptional regulator with XRE-family HTH domain